MISRVQHSTGFDSWLKLALWDGPACQTNDSRLRMILCQGGVALELVTFNGHLNTSATGRLTSTGNAVRTSRESRREHVTLTPFDFDPSRVTNHTSRLVPSIDAGTTHAQPRLQPLGDPPSGSDLEANHRHAGRQQPAAPAAQRSSTIYLMNVTTRSRRQRRDDKTGGGWQRIVQPLANKP